MAGKQSTEKMTISFTTTDGKPKTKKPPKQPKKQEHKTDQHIEKMTISFHKVTITNAEEKPKAKKPSKQQKKENHTDHSEKHQKTPGGSPSKSNFHQNVRPEKPIHVVVAEPIREALLLHIAIPKIVALEASILLEILHTVNLHHHILKFKLLGQMFSLHPFLLNLNNFTFPSETLK